MDGLPGSDLRLGAVAGMVHLNHAAPATLAAGAPCGARSLAGRPRRHQPLQQLDLPGVVQVVRGHAADEARDGPRPPAAGRGRSRRESRHGARRRSWHAAEECEVFAPGASVGRALASNQFDPRARTSPASRRETPPRAYFQYAAWTAISTRRAALGRPPGGGGGAQATQAAPQVRPCHERRSYASSTSARSAATAGPAFAMSSSFGADATSTASASPRARHRGRRARRAETRARGVEPRRRVERRHRIRQPPAEASATARSTRAGARPARGAPLPRARRRRPRAARAEQQHAAEPLPGLGVPGSSWTDSRSNAASSSQRSSVASRSDSICRTAPRRAGRCRGRGPPGTR